MVTRVWLGVLQLRGVASHQDVSLQYFFSLLWKGFLWVVENKGNLKKQINTMVHLPVPFPVGFA